MRRRTPEGCWVENIEAYQKSWLVYVQPLLDATGWELMGYDPQFLLQTKGHELLSLTKESVTELCDALYRVMGPPKEGK